MPGVLENLKVVELGGGLSTSQVGLLFADFGAEVITIEPPGGVVGRREPGFLFLARGKKSIVLDIEDPADADVARALMAQADVVITQEGPARLGTLGLDADSLIPLNHRLIYTQITGFGTKGHLANAKADEAMVAAKLGLNQSFAVLTERAGPSWSSTPWASWAGSQTASQGIFAALRERESSGAGQRLDVSLAHSLGGYDPYAQTNASLEKIFPEAFSGGGSMYSPEGAPYMSMLFKLLVAITKDGHWLQFSQVQPRLFRDFIEACGLGWMYTDEKWSEFVTMGTETIMLPSEASVEMRFEFWNLLFDIVRSKTLQEWQQMFDEWPNVFAEVFRRGTDLLHHRQLEVERQLTTVTDSQHGAVLQPGPLVRLDDHPAQVSTSAPTLGEHGVLLRARAAEPLPQPQPVPDAPSTLPLEGVTILELAMFYAAPYGSTILTDLGARVIKLEVPAGDPTRTQQAFPESGGVKVLQGKESVALDLGAPGAREIVARIAQEVDIVMCSFRAGAADRLGLGFEELKAMNPHIIYLDCPGFGTLAPQGAKPAFAPTIAAGSGITMRNVGILIPEGVPETHELTRTYAKKLSAGGMTSAAQPDGLAAFGVGTALAMAAYLQSIGIEGERMLTTMLGSAAHALGEGMVEFDGRWSESSTDREILGFSALERLYETSDGWVALSVTAPHEWDALVQALNPQLDDDRFATSSLRSEHDAAIIEALSKAFMANTATQWESTMLDAGVPLLEVNTGMSEHIILGPLAEEHGWLARANSPIFGELPRMAPFQQFSRSKTQALPGNTIGQHTEKVLKEVGYSDDAIAAFADEGLILLG